MIRHDISYKALSARVAEHNVSWLNRAKLKTDKFTAQGYYDETSTIWSEIKPVYMDLQHHKCAFCERQLEGGSVEQDMEHFRPKGNIKDWHSAYFNMSITSAPNEGGYHKLPYHLFNYSASCKHCNSTLKRDYFPIAADYHLKGDDPASLNGTEQPYLLYPIGDIDSAPQDLIKFNGISPYAASNDPHQKQRGLINIEFFKLDDTRERKFLVKERATMIIVLWTLLQSQTADAKTIIEKYRNDSSEPHTNCGRCFIELYETDNAQAQTFFVEATSYIASTS